MVSQVISWIPQLLSGARITILLTVSSVTMGLFLSIFLALGKMSKKKILSGICNAYIFFFRGTPLLMQLYFIYFGLPQISMALTINNRFLAAFLAFSLNSAAYCSEIIRAAIQSIDKGQTEAGRSTGLTQAQTMLYIIWPQAFRRMIPPLTNQCIISLKDTSLLVVIGVGELTRQGQEIIAVNFRAFEVWLTVAIFYLAMTLSISAVLRYYERKLMIGRRAVPASPSDPQM